MRKKRDSAAPPTHQHVADDYIFTDTEKDDLCAKLMGAEDKAGFLDVLGEFVHNLESVRYLRLHGTLSSMPTAFEQWLGRMCLLNIHIDEKVLRVMRAIILLESLHYNFNVKHLESRWRPEEAIATYTRLTGEKLRTILSGAIYNDLSSIKTEIDNAVGL